MKNLRLSLPPEVALDGPLLKEAVLNKLKWADSPNTHVMVRRRSIDARSNKVLVHLDIQVFQEEPIPAPIAYNKDLKPVHDKEPVIIVGAGPAGLFAALRLIELGHKPLIIERGKDVQSRRRDLAAINKEHLVNPNSNYCFGEGGAGTYSDGKLYTRAKKRGDSQRILQILVAHGAPDDILIDSHPHIGTNKLPKVVQSLRETILEAGGEVIFEKTVREFTIKQGKIVGVKDHCGGSFEGRSVILATGHSARDIFQLLHESALGLEVKPFAMGVRVEHPQSLIDKIQYHRASRGLLPAASYALSHQSKRLKRGVFSFCMCPGGFIVPAATNPGEVVVNGMSPSRRDSLYANSGIVVSVGGEDFHEFQDHGPLAGMYYQQALEKSACQAAGNTQAAPAQRLMDFLKGKDSQNLPESSYQPGLTPVDMRMVLGEPLTQGIKEGFKMFGKRMRGYLTNEAQIVGVESRTSSPVRIPRDAVSLQHPQVEGLFPCGEGAGYAGGIMSAALDGMRCAEAAGRCK